MSTNSKIKINYLISTGKRMKNLSFSSSWAHTPISSVLQQSSTEKQTELYNINFIKTILMILIVLYHSISFWNSWFTKDPVYSSEILNQMAQWLNSFHIYAFALVSGYLFYYLKIEKEKYDKFIPFATNKFKRLVIPYIFVAVVWVIPIQSIFFDTTVSSVIEKYVLGIAPSQLWFLLMLFSLFMLFYPLSKFFAKHTAIGAVIVLGIYGLSLVGGKLVPNVFQLWSACAYLPLFWIGFKLRQYGTSRVRKIPVLVWIAVDIALFILTQYISNFDGFILKLLGLGFGFVLHILVR